MLDRVQLYDTALQEVDEATRRGHDDVRAVRQLAELRPQAAGAEERHGAERRVLRESRGLLLDLLSQLPRRHEHQRDRPSRALPRLPRSDVRHADHPRGRHQLPPDISCGQLELEGHEAVHEAADLGQRRLAALHVVLGLEVGGDHRPGLQPRQAVRGHQDGEEVASRLPRAREGGYQEVLVGQHQRDAALLHRSDAVVAPIGEAGLEEVRQLQHLDGLLESPHRLHLELLAVDIQDRGHAIPVGLVEVDGLVVLLDLPILLQELHAVGLVLFVLLLVDLRPGNLGLCLDLLGLGHLLGQQRGRQRREHVRQRPRLPDPRLASGARRRARLLVPEGPGLRVLVGVPLQLRLRLVRPLLLR
mmetsp:Transcript_719/g.2294  ORF Transcript_719/g.2294 Transcript_719/m.2294 type:complete len:360 (-) Transcript_719:315-1394(-)